MKNKHKPTIIVSVVFVATFMASYICLCYMVPGLRIKLDAEPMEYFIKSIKHMMLVKGAMALVVAAIPSCIITIIRRKRGNK